MWGRTIPEAIEEARRTGEPSAAEFAPSVFGEGHYRREGLLSLLKTVAAPDLEFEVMATREVLKSFLAAPKSVIDGIRFEEGATDQIGAVRIKVRTQPR